MQQRKVNKRKVNKRKVNKNKEKESESNIAHTLNIYKKTY